MRPKNRGRFCSPECGHKWKAGRPAPGFTTPDSDRRQRIAANGLINKRLKLGWFTRAANCAKCKLPKKTEFHHPDYSYPDQGYWLCRSCHVIAHHDPSSLIGLRLFIADDKRKAVGRG